jgi:predicted MFS family arabinose efflux permease
MIMHLFPKLAFLMGVPADLHGTVLAAMRVLIVGLYLLMHNLPFWHGRFVYSVVVHGLALAGLLALFAIHSLAGLVIGLLGLAVLVGYNYFAGLYYSNAGTGSEHRGANSGMHEATLGLGLASGSICGGFVGDFAGVRAPYLLAAAVVAALLLWQVILYFRKFGIGGGPFASPRN